MKIDSKFILKFNNNYAVVPGLGLFSLNSVFFWVELAGLLTLFPGKIPRRWDSSYYGSFLYCGFIPS